MSLFYFYTENILLNLKNQNNNQLEPELIEKKKEIGSLISFYKNNQINNDKKSNLF